MKGFGQKIDVDFNEIFSLVVKISSIQVVLGMATSIDLTVEQLNARLHSFMVTWSRRSTCYNLKVLKKKVKKILFAN